MNPRGEGVLARAFTYGSCAHETGWTFSIKKLSSQPHMSGAYNILRNCQNTLGIYSINIYTGTPEKCSLISSSYESFKDRTVHVGEVKVKKKSGRETTRREWCSRLSGIIGHVILDEGHRAKDRDTRTHARILTLKADYLWIVTATLMQNTEKVGSHQKYFSVGQADIACARIS